MTAAEVSDGLGLDTLKGRQWSIHKSCAIKGEGLEEGLDWYVTFPHVDSAFSRLTIHSDTYNTGW
jgi:hypothetical protein